MGIWNLLKFSTRMFKAKTTRTFLTILGMGVGIGAILFLVALGYGIQKTLLETITTADSLLTLDVYPGEGRQLIEQAEVDKISGIGGVALISSALEIMGQIKYGGLVSDSRVLAIDENFLNLEGLKVVKGEALGRDSIDKMVISGPLAKIFEKTPEAMLGERIKIFFPSLGDEAGLELEVSGFIDSKEMVVYISQQTIRGRFAVAAFSQLKVKCSSGQIMDETRNEIVEEGFIVSALTDIIHQVEKTFQVARVILGFFGAIALIVSAIGMFNTMIVALLERTEEIGIMKSVGASDFDILWMFVCESTIMGFLGGIVGIVLAWLVSGIFNVLFNLVAERMGGYSISLFYFPAWFMFFILSIATVVGFFTGLIPARRASVTDPLRALRYK